MTDLVFLQISADSIAVGHGVLRNAESPSGPSFYRNDFFLTSNTPWIIPEHYEEISISTFKERFLANSKLSENIDWQTSDDQKFRKFFQKIKQSIEEGLIEKIVPVSFESGAIPNAWSNKVLTVIASRLSQYLSSDLYLFGYQNNNSGVCGLTPELVFEKHGTSVISAALAGTKASHFGDRAIKNPKDIREHQLVIDDLIQSLTPLGKVKLEETAPYWNGSLIHLRAKISLLCDAQTDPSFEALVRTIHPTAALGVFPRTSNAQAILKGSDQKIPRGYFASPFGVLRADGSSLCIASIRSVFWKEINLKIKSIKDKLLTH